MGKDLPRFTAPRSNSVNQTQQRPALAWRLMPHRTSRRKRSNARRFAATSRLSARSRAACSATKRRHAAASARAACEYRPCFHRARRLRSSPSGVRGPVLLPPCIRHRPFRIAGARQAVPRRVRAPHRGAVAGSPGGLPCRNQPWDTFSLRMGFIGDKPPPAG